MSMPVAQTLQASSVGVSSDDTQQMQFMINNVKAEIDYMKKMFTIDKLKEIDAAKEAVRKLTTELELMQMELQVAAKHTDIERLLQRFADFAPISALKNI